MSSRHMLPRHCASGTSPADASCDPGSRRTHEANPQGPTLSCSEPCQSFGADVYSRTYVVASDDARDREQESNGTGWQGMADRLDAVGGELDVTSAPGTGTTVLGRVPATGAAR